MVTRRYEPLQPFEHYDHGKDADASFPNLLKNAKVTDLTGTIGAEVTGVQLSSLTEAGKNELALLVAQKKVVGKHHFLQPLPRTMASGPPGETVHC